MPSPLPYFQFYHRDYLSSSLVAQMPLVAEAIYMKLLMFQWEDGSLPSSAKALQRMVRATDDQWLEFAEFVDQAFPEGPNGRRENPRMAKDRNAAEEKVEKNKAAGSKGGSSKQTLSDPEPKSNQPESECQANAKRTLSERPAIPDTDTDTYISSDTNVSGESKTDPPAGVSLGGLNIDHPQKKPPSEPFATVERIMKAVAVELELPDPVREEVTPFLGKNSPLLRLVAKYGEPETVNLMVFSTKSTKTGLSWHQLWNQNAVMMAKMRSNPPDLPPKPESWMGAFGGVKISA